MLKFTSFVAATAVVLSACGSGTSTPSESQEASGTETEAVILPVVLRGELPELDLPLSMCENGIEVACETVIAEAPETSEYAAAASSALSEVDMLTPVQIEELASFLEEGCVTALRASCESLDVILPEAERDPNLDNTIESCGGDSYLCEGDLFDNGSDSQQLENYSESLAATAAKACDNGLMEACDQLRLFFPVGSPEELAARACGKETVIAVNRTCADAYPAPEQPEAPTMPMVYGDDIYLDALFDTCSELGGESCDVLRRSSPPESDYAALAATCGPLGEFNGVSCDLEFPVAYGDNEMLDSLSDECTSGVLGACDSLRWELAGPGYAETAMSCGGTRSLSSFEVFVDLPCDLDGLSGNHPFTDEMLQGMQEPYEEARQEGWKWSWAG